MFGVLRRFFTRTVPRSRRPDVGGRLEPECRYVVTIDDRRVTCRHPSGREDEIAWDELDEVIVETNDTGPWGTDVFWVLLGHKSRTGCVIPQGATGERELLGALQRLPGFDNKQLIAAMTCTENRAFHCWRRFPEP